MSGINCWHCEGKYQYEHSNSLNMAYKGVMMKPGKMYCIAKGKAKLIKNEFSQQSFCPKVAKPHYLLWLSQAEPCTYDCAANFKISQTFKQAPFNAYSDIETIEKWLQDNGTSPENGDIVCVLGESGTSYWKNNYGSYTELTYFNIKQVPKLPEKLIKLCV